MPPDAALGILLLSGAYERAHYAFMLAAGAGAIGRQVVVFASNAGCHALCRDWSGLRDAAADAATRRAGVAGLEELRAAALELDARLLACDAGLRLSGIAASALVPEAQVSGIPAFLSAVGAGQVITL